MTDAQKISKILEIKGLEIAAAERLCGIKGTVLTKLIQRNGKLSEFNREKVLRTFHVKSVWWEKGYGEIFDQKGTEDSKVEEQSGNGNYDLIKTKNQVIQAQLDLIAELRERINELKASLDECRAQASKEKVQLP